MISDVDVNAGTDADADAHVDVDVDDRNRRFFVGPPNDGDCTTSNNPPNSRICSISVLVLYTCEIDRVAD